MVALARTIDALPAVMVTPLAPSHFQHVPYSSALLLPVRFDASITDDLCFADACKGGFEGYFEDMLEWDESGDDFVFVDRCYTWAEVERVICDDLLSTPFLLPGVAPASLAFNAGYTLGWLSALALSERALALRGASLLCALADHLLFCQSSVA